MTILATAADHPPQAELLVLFTLLAVLGVVAWQRRR